MKIGILGAGRMTAALASQWIQAGHEVLIGGRTPEKTTELVTQLGENAYGGTFADAVAFSDVLLIAVRHEGVMETLEKAGAATGAFNGKVLIDCSNPVSIETFNVVGNAENSLAERIQTVATGVTVVKAFNLCEAQVWEMTPPVFDNRTLVVPYCGDSEAARQIASTLIADVGCQPMYLGKLYFARHLEAMAAMVISLLFSGYDAHSVFNFVTPDVAKINK